jgi:hypothetical protein
MLTVYIYIFSIVYSASILIAEVNIFGLAPPLLQPLPVNVIGATRPDRPSRPTCWASLGRHTGEPMGLRTMLEVV